MPNLAEALLSTPPREVSGSQSANRFEFQRTWALCHLLHLHEMDQHYVLVLEFHDDVLVLDHDLSPQQAEFFQVKTRKTGSWSKNDLLKISKAPGKKNTADVQADRGSEKNTPTSVLGKLMDHLRHLAPYIKTLNIVSNMRFNLPLNQEQVSIDRERFSLNELTEAALKEVKEAIQSELNLEEEPPWEKVYLSTCSMSIEGHEKYGIGELAAFLERRQPGGRFAVQPLFRTLCGELTRRATNEWKPASFEELCLRKGIRRSDLEGFLSLAHDQPDMGEQLRSAKEQLTREGLRYREVFDVERSWRRYYVEKMDQSNTIVQIFKDQVMKIVSDISQSSAWHTLSDFLAESETAFYQKFGGLNPPFDKHYLKGALLLEFKAQEARELSTFDSQSTTQTP